MKDLYKIILILILACRPYEFAYSGTADPSGASVLFGWMYGVTHPWLIINAMQDKKNEDQQIEFLSAATKQCEIAKNDLPQHIDVDEFVDDGAGGTTYLILDFLSNRNLKAVYFGFRPSPIQAGFKQFASGGQWVGAWRVPESRSGKYIKIELAASNSPSCLPNNWMPSDVEEKLSVPPFLPGTCVAGTLTDYPSTPFHLEYEGKGKFLELDIGKWRVKNNNTGDIIAEMAGVEPKGGPYPSPVCPSSYGILLSKIKSSNSAASKFIVSRKEIKVSPAPEDVIKSEGNFRSVNASVRDISFGTSEEEQRFGYDLSRKRWEALVEFAKVNGIAFGKFSVLNWKSKELITYSTSNSYKWQLSVTPSGVYAYSFDKQYGNGKNWLIRYDLHGNFVSAQEILVTGNGCAGSARALEIREGIVALYGTCVGSRGSLWELPKAGIL